jgi:DNA polymerase III alpha subunit
MAKLWQKVFDNYLICVDTSKESNEFKKYEDFYKVESNAILFCANKHREGSDIKNLDCCIFLDKVENRCPKVFLQCIGRVLRVDKKNQKTFGLVIDVRAKNSLVICNNLNSYLNLPHDIFPWSFNYELRVSGKKMLKINSLEMIKDNDERSKELKIDKYEENNKIEDLKSLFLREVPDSELYKERLDYELKMLFEKNLISHLRQAVEILNITKKIPHVTRGSCGSSLVCYLLGISHIDPLKNNIKFARFLTNYRSNLPDIDLDFPHNQHHSFKLYFSYLWILL